MNKSCGETKFDCLVVQPVRERPEEATVTTTQNDQDATLPRKCLSYPRTNNAFRRPTQEKTICFFGSIQSKEFLALQERKEFKREWER